MHVRRNPERPLERQRLKECHAQSVHVRSSLIADLAEELLGSHVQGRSRAVSKLLRSGDIQVAAKTEVGEVDRSSESPFQQNVGRLDVAVRHLSLMSRFKRPGNPGQKPNHGPEVLRLGKRCQPVATADQPASKPSATLGNHLAQRAPLDERHDKVNRPLALTKLLDR